MARRCPLMVTFLELSADGKSQVHEELIDGKRLNSFCRLNESGVQDDNCLNAHFNP